MNTHSDLNEYLKKGFLKNELELERALILDRSLKLLSKDSPKFAEQRKQLREIIKQYESKKWSKESVISDDQLKESDLAEITAEVEIVFLLKRKSVIKSKLAFHQLNQQDLGFILGHSKSYISELMGGLSPFSMKDIVIIHKLFDIPFEQLIPSIIQPIDQQKIKISLLKLNKSIAL